MDNPRRRPRPASSSHPLPRVDRLAAALALGAASTLAASGCHRPPLCLDERASEPRDAAHASWWTRVRALVTCEHAGGGTGDGQVISPPGAIAITGPQPLPNPPPHDPVQIDGAERAVGPQPPPAMGGGAAVSVTPQPPEHVQRTTRVRHHH